ncbi:zinc-binding dehydrogenase [Amycolatopsis rhizosphaerae]|uniref:Zinc-binding dehydrogenase n=1 Tax=Amycolatopsis rhizosphaerae TaxID=2053003 RepID=A0A558DJG9_9PSEU|nr:zinc-binding dehydrogenase [Amycolatopsis rhizosphaerae]TVT61157.1 zinc-binding dehydrogenase [Amycolatopsis rhizosphaerae]
MFAISAVGTDAADPLSGLRAGEWPDPSPGDGWTMVTVRAASLNRHDLWTLRGVVPAHQRLPIVLGSDAAGVDDEGNEVLVHSVIGSPGRYGDETLDPHRSVLSEKYDGTFAERVAVPARNLVPKPASLSFEEAACLPGSWLTAYRMLFEQAPLGPGATVLVQGAGGGVATALIALGRAAGLRVWVTGSTGERRERAERLGAEATFPPGARLPCRVDAVMETVGEATWAHSMRSVRSGGYIVVSGATTGAAPAVDLTHVFYRQLTITGCTLGTREQLVRLLRFCAEHRLAPTVDRVMPLSQARAGFQAMAEGTVFGKVVFTV